MKAGRCVDPPTPDAPLELRESGEEITECPMKYITPDVTDFGEAAALSDVALPAPGALLQQTHKYNQALQVYREHDRYWRRHLRLDQP